MSIADSSIYDTLSSRVRLLGPTQIRIINDLGKPTSLNLGLGQPSLPVDGDILSEGLLRLKKRGMGYTANAGLADLRAQIAVHHAIPGCLSSDNVVITCGSQEAIMATLASCTEAGDDILVADPCFPGYLTAASFLGLRVLPVGRRLEFGFRLETAAIAESLTPNTKVVVVNSPSNPTGMMDTAKEVEALAKLAEERGFIILSDEIYADLYYGQEQAVSPSRFGRRTVVVSGLSKNCAMTGFRLGYAIAQSDIMTGILRAHAVATGCAPTISQHMAAFIFEKAERLTRHLPTYVERRECALVALRQLPSDVEVLEPEGAFYVMINLSAYTADAFLFARTIVEKIDVLTTPGTAFGEVARTWLRLSFAGEAHLFAEGVRRIGEFLRLSKV